MVVRPVVVTLHEKPDLKAVPKDSRATLDGKVDFDKKTGTLTFASCAAMP